MKLCLCVYGRKREELELLKKKKKQTKNRPYMVSLVLKPMMPNLDLISNVIAVSTPTRNAIKNQLVWNFQ